MDWWSVIGGIAMRRRTSEGGTRVNPAAEEYKRAAMRTPGMIGALGPIIFTVSNKKIETLKDYKRRTRARIASHDVIGGEKSVLEYIGGEASEITFSMQLARDLGVDVETELIKLDSMVNSGVAYYFILGGEVIGYDRWYVSELGETLNYVDRYGIKWFATAEVTLREAVL